LKTSEEATCEDNICKGFVFTNVIPKVTAATTEYDSSNKVWKVKATGTGFTGDASSVKFLVGGVQQTTELVSKTEAVFIITNVTNSLLSNVKLYFDIGLPDGLDLLNANLILTAKPESISPSQGSVGGTLLTVNVPGIGKGTLGLNLADKDKKALCAEVTIPEYGKLQCWTNSVEILGDS
jgi:hypothetical protein